MLVAALTLGVGIVCLYYAARALRTGRAVRRLVGAGAEGPEGAGRPADWPDAGGTGPDEPGETIRERGSVERGVVLLALGLLCLLFGVLAA